MESERSCLGVRCGVLAVSGATQRPFLHEVLEHDVAGHVPQSEEPGGLIERKAKPRHFPVGPNYRGHQLLALRFARGLMR